MAAQLRPFVMFFGDNHGRAAHEVLIDGGTELMPLDEYPFSSCFTWLQDRWGITWQISVAL